MQFRFISLFIALIIISSASVRAQRADSVTREELKKYALAMDSIDDVKSQLTQTINKLAKGNSKITAARYNQLLPIADDNVKLKEVKATPDEIDYVRKALATRNEETLKFQNSFLSIINFYFDITVFGKVRDALVNDASLKEKYDALRVKLAQH